MTGSPFSQRMITALVLIGSVTFALAAYLSIYEDVIEPQGRPGPTPYSTSAIGHSVFTDWLEELGIPIVLSRKQRLSLAGGDGVLLMMEPQPGVVDADTLTAFVASRPTLLVLPKWRGRPDQMRHGWISQATLLAAGDISKTIAPVLPDHQLERPQALGEWSGPLLDAGTLAPDLVEPQLIASEDLEPLIATSEGILFGRGRDITSVLYVLADPDLLNNHGIRRGDNAEILARVIDTIRPDDEVLIVDVTMHGFTSDQNLWRTVLEPPFIVSTLCALAAVLALVWAAAPRFGAPDIRPPAFRHGRDVLVDNTANVVHAAGHAKAMLPAYLRAMLRRAQDRFGALSHIGETERIRLLDRRAREAGVADSIDQLALDTTRTDGTETQVLRTAQRIYKWKQGTEGADAGD